MPAPRTRFDWQRLVAELQRRRVFRVLVMYAAAAFVALQAADLLIEPLGMPAWTMRSLIVVLAIGLVLALALAWMFELTSAGVQRDTGTISAEPFQPLTSASTSARTRFLAAALVAVVLITALLAYRGIRDDELTSVAVLPFDNLSAQQENAYFSDGIQQDILTQLAKVEGLKVISGGSVQRYRGVARDMRTIGRELDVHALLEGSVQRVGQRVRVTAQLIDARTDEHLWADRYDRDLTDVFAIQTEIAQQIVGALKAELTAAERDRIQRSPTSHPEAYELLLRARSLGTFSGNAARPHYSGAPSREAEQLLLRAIDIDPTYAEAHAALAHLYTWRCFDEGPAVAAAATRAAERALELAPDLAEGFAAKGHVLWLCDRRLTEALTWLNAALERLPSDADITQSIGGILRNLGRYDEGARMLARSAELNPMAPDYHYHAARTYAYIDEFREAERYYRQSILVQPGYVPSIIELGEMYLDETGRLDSLRAAIRTSAAVTRQPTTPVNGRSVLDAARYRLALYDGDFGAALEALEESESILTRGWGATNRPLEFALLLELMGDTTRARVYADSARALVERQLAEAPNPDRHSTLARAYVLLGRMDDALAHARQGYELFPHDATRAVSDRALDLAWVLARAGEVDEAAALIEANLAGDAGTTVPRLRLDPRWNFLRRHARFEPVIQPRPHT